MWFDWLHQTLYSTPVLWRKIEKNISNEKDRVNNIENKKIECDIRSNEKYDQTRYKTKCKIGSNILYQMLIKHIYTQWSLHTFDIKYISNRALINVQVLKSSYQL